MFKTVRDTAKNVVRNVMILKVKLKRILNKCLEKMVYVLKAFRSDLKNATFPWKATPVPTGLQQFVTTKFLVSEGDASKTREDSITNIILKLYTFQKGEL